MDSLPCTICKINTWKYKCPVCGRRTCSLQCSKTHKMQFECTGKLDSTQYIDRIGLTSTPHVLNRDYQFLQRIGRRLELKRADDEKRGICSKRFRKNVMVKNGVTVNTVPYGMDRAKLNKSAWNPKKKRYMWTVEWMDIRQESPSYHRREVLDDTILASALNVGESANADARIWLDGPSGLEELDPSMILSVALNGKTVVEFPTLLISGPDLPDCYKQRTVEPSKNDNASSDYSTSENDDDSEVDESGADENHSVLSEEAPEEVSSKSSTYQHSTIRPTSTD